MTREPIDIKQVFEPYHKRIKSTFFWTFVLYFILVFAVGLYSDFGKPFLTTIIFLAVLSLLDFVRRLRWIRYVIHSLETNSSGIILSYYDKNSLKNVTIAWGELHLSRGETFTKFPRKTITVQKDGERIATFYANNKIESLKLNELYNKLTELKNNNVH